jgi:C1A family cysteine protease
MRLRRSPAVLLVVATSLVACSSSSTPTASDDIASGSDLTLADVQRAIAARGAKWIAGTNQVTALPQAGRAGMLGVPMSEISEERVTIVEETANEDFRVELPAAYDWRERDGKNFVSPMLDQGRCGSCVAFAAVATYETQLNIAASDTSSPWQLSPQYLFSCGGGGCGFGWMPEAAARFLVNKGVTDNACMPYTSGAHGDNVRCNTACTNASERVMKPIAYARPTTGGASIPAVKRALLKGPLMASMVVYDDFMFYAGGVYKHVAGARAGGHAVSIVGWNDERQSWIVRNSWGARWGVNGYFEIAWDDDATGVGERTWSLEVPPPGPYVTFYELRDGEVLSGKKPLSFSTQAVGSAPLSWTLLRARPKWSRVARARSTRWRSPTARTRFVRTPARAPAR